MSAVLLVSLGTMHSPADEISLFVVTGQSNARANYALGIESGLRASNQWENVKIYHSQRGGNPLSNWVAGVDGVFSESTNYTQDLWAADGSSALQQMIADLESQGHTVTVEGFFWFQGESDTLSIPDIQQYRSRINWMFNTLRGHYGNFDLVMTIIDYNRERPDFIEILGPPAENIEALRTILVESASDLSAATMDSKGWARLDRWHVGDANDPRGQYGISTDFGADQAGLMVSRAQCQADINGDGSINFLDISAFIQLIGAGCP
ncbi:MAG: sialate O-acetylesterase [Phycisphaerales bacterium]